MTDERGAAAGRALQVGGVVAIVALFLVVAWLLWSGSEPAVTRPAAGPASTAPPSAPVTSAPTPAMPGEEPERQLVEAAAATPEPDGSPEAARVIRGRVIAVDAAGNEHHETAGELELVLWDERSGHHAHVTVAGGRFTVEPRESTTSISVRSASLEGRSAYVPDTRLGIAAELEIRARWLAPLRLRVVDAAYGLDLTDLTVVTSSDWRTDENPHPGAYRAEHVRVEGGRSPLELTPPSDHVRWQEPLWVHSPGYAWGRINVDYATAAERRVELQRGGDLEVVLAGRLPAPAHARDRGPSDEPAVPTVRLRPVAEPADIDALVRDAMARLAEVPAGELDGKRPTAAEVRESIVAAHAQPLRGKPVAGASASIAEPAVFEGLVPGRYHVSVELGNWWDSPLAFGATAATVTAGARESVTVRVEPPPERGRVPLAGTLFLPPAWELSWLDLRFEPLGIEGKTPDMERSINLRDMQPDPATAGLYRWDAGLVVAARYEVTCYTLDMQWVVDTGPNGNRTAEIVVGEPVDVRVQVLDEAARESISSVQVLWNGKRPEGVTGGSLGSSEWNPKSERHEFRCAAGPIDLMVMSKDYAVVDGSSFVVAPQNRDLVLRVQRTCGVVLRLEHGGQVVPWDDTTIFDIEAREVDGPRGETGSGGVENHGQYLRVAGPGTYRISVPDQPGYEPIAPFEVHVEAGRFVEREIPLVPKR